MEISWEAPETGVHGGYIDASALTYTVKRNGWKEVAKGISDMKAQDVVDNLSGSQLLVSYGVTACSEAGEGETAGSESIMVGTHTGFLSTSLFPVVGQHIMTGLRCLWVH